LGTTCEGDFENVCGLTAFQDRCEDRWRTTLGIGAGARWHVRPSFYVGVDYTWLSYGRHVLVGTVGLR
jgi:opacity protein-like surface antigen